MLRFIREIKTKRQERAAIYLCVLMFLQQARVPCERRGGPAAERAVVREGCVLRVLFGRPGGQTRKHGKKKTRERGGRRRFEEREGAGRHES